MKEENRQFKSIFGKWWMPIRKWFYSTWMVYELSIRFYDYALLVHNYWLTYQANFAKQSVHYSLAFIAGAIVFLVCTFFLTLPAAFLLFRFFDCKNLTITSFETKIKKYF